MTPLPDHPEPQVMRWTDLERESIQKYGDDCERAARVQALEEVALLCDEFGDDYMQQAREGDNSGASDHKACAATEIADAIRRSDASGL